MELSIIYTYYNQEKMLKRHFEHWESYPPEVDIILIDDHSKKIPEVPKRVRLFRAEKDIAWGQPAARNFGVSQAKYDTVIIADIDYIIPLSELIKMNALDKKKEHTHRFARNLNGKIGTDFKSVIMMQKKYFQEIRGYDEDFCGNYGYDDTFFFEWIHRKGGKFPMHESIVLLCYSGGDADAKELSRVTTTNHKLFENKCRWFGSCSFSPSKKGYKYKAV